MKEGDGKDDKKKEEDLEGKLKASEKSFADMRKLAGGLMAKLAEAEERLGGWPLVYETLKAKYAELEAEIKRLRAPCPKCGGDGKMCLHCGEPSGGGTGGR